MGHPCIRALMKSIARALTGCYWPEYLAAGRFRVRAREVGIR